MPEALSGESKGHTCQGCTGKTVQTVQLSGLYGYRSREDRPLRAGLPEQSSGASSWAWVWPEARPSARCIVLPEAGLWYKHVQGLQQYKAEPCVAGPWRVSRKGTLYKLMSMN